MDFRNERADVEVRSKYNSYEVRETLEARVARLLREVNDTQSEVQASRKSTRLEGFDKTAKSLAQLEAILQRIQAQDDDTDTTMQDEGEPSGDSAARLGAQTDRLLERLDAQVESGARKHGAGGVQVSSAQISKIASLEHRVAALEKVIGVADLDSRSEGYRPILSSLQEIRQRLKLVTSSPASIETSANNLKVLLESVKQIRLLKEQQTEEAGNGNGRGGGNDAFAPTAAVPDPGSVLRVSPDAHGSGGTPLDSTQQINALYGKIAVVQKFEVVLPKVLERLRALRDLHMDALAANESIKGFDGVVLALKTDIKSWKDAVELMQQNMTAFKTQSDANRTEMEGWVAELKQHADERDR